jgi:hypothetical protein
MAPTLDALISCEPTLQTQLTLAAIQAVFWAAAIPTVAALGALYVKKQPWRQQVCSCKGLRASRVTGRPTPHRSGCPSTVNKRPLPRPTAVDQTQPLDLQEGLLCRFQD